MMFSYNYPNKNIGVLGNQKAMVTDLNAGHFRVLPGLCGVPGTISFESLSQKGNYLRHQNSLMWLHEFDDKSKRDFCFFPRSNKFFPVSNKMLLLLYLMKHDLIYVIHYLACA